MLPPVVKNLLIINVLMFVATLFLRSQDIVLETILGLYYFDSPNFQPYQIIAHMFMHSSSFFAHIFFNMFMLWMFGRTLEQVWGPKRFLIFYMVTGLGAALLHTGVNAFEVYRITGSLFNDISFGAEYVYFGDNLEGLTNKAREQLARIYATPTVGASGAVFGLLLGFGMLFPNTKLMLLFFPVPIKAKYVIGGLIVLELILGSTAHIWNSPIAHFAHLGGALFGFILIKIWQRSRNKFY